MTSLGAVDEMVDGRGGVRPHWRAVLAALSGMEHSVLAERARRLEVAAEEEGAAPAWHCDPVPLPLTTAEFTLLEDGLGQRARLLEAMLADIHGPQRMLSEGWLPPALLHANPAYLRACRSVSGGAVGGGAVGGEAGGGRMLQNYAADLVRGPDGHWRVLADRTGGGIGDRVCAGEPASAGAGAAGAVPVDAGAAAAGRSSRLGRTRCCGWGRRRAG